MLSFSHGILCTFLLSLPRTSSAFQTGQGPSAGPSSSSDLPTCSIATEMNRRLRLAPLLQSSSDALLVQRRRLIPDPGAARSIPMTR
ncbi:hypothetical protein Celaphus_00011683 [Cervus elaphus hippelaphus]|uniref:Secreted protein n=1 Tax=Cervus elaphus hippelaphus TaxID=46360 RepID=A0A212DEI7_CEREH|nr:hypothetical protein Celaphus_00011683 [Cervus elaphus hippelaphus]